MKNPRIKLLFLSFFIALSSSFNQLYAGIISTAQTAQDKDLAINTQLTEKKGEKLKNTPLSMEENINDQPILKINVNTATAEQLAKALHGIGVKKAEAIVNYREQYGIFTSLEQLKEVPGIGPVFLERNLSRMTL